MENLVQEKDLHWIASILVESSEMVRNKQFLSVGLGLPFSAIEDLRMTTMVNRIDSYGFFVLTLRQWIARAGKECTFTKLITVLREMDLKSTADKLRWKVEKPHYTPPKYPSTASPWWFEVPDKVMFFTGRIEEMHQLHEDLLKQAEDSGLVLSTVITGLGGIGKTALSVHYAWTFSRTFYQNIIWINAESANSIVESFCRLAKRIWFAKKNEIVPVDLVYSYFRKRSSRTLFVFDNAESFSELKEYLPVLVPGEVKPYVLITSRCTNWNLRCNNIDLNVLNLLDSGQFFKDYLDLRSEEEIALASYLAQSLQNLPLAIVQAAAFIKFQFKQKDRTGLLSILEQYCEELLENEEKFLNFEYWRMTVDSYENTLYTTYNITLSKINAMDPHAIKIFNLVCYFDCNDIPMNSFDFVTTDRFLFGSFFQGALALGLGALTLGLGLMALGPWLHQVANKKLDAMISLNLLENYSMIRINVNHKTFNVHRLVQRVIRLQVEQNHLLNVLHEAVSLMERLLIFPKNEMTKFYVVHAQRMVAHISTHKLRTKYASFIRLCDSVQKNQLPESE